MLFTSHEQGVTVMRPSCVQEEHNQGNNRSEEKAERFPLFSGEASSCSRGCFMSY